MIDPGLYRLKQVDYSQRGEVIHAIVDGLAKPQTVIFSGSITCFLIRPPQPEGVGLRNGMPLKRRKNQVMHLFFNNGLLQRKMLFYRGGFAIY